MTLGADGAVVDDGPGVARRGPYRTSRAKRERILAAALAHFSRDGYEASSLRAIAQDAGMSHASVLHHYGSKEELFLAVLEEQESLDSVILVDLDRSQTLEGLADALATVLQRYVDDPSRGRLWPLLAASAAGQAEHPASEFVSQRYRSWASGLADQLTAAQARGLVAPDVDASAAAAGLLAMTTGLVPHAIADPSVQVRPILWAWLSRLSPDAGTNG